MLKLGIVMILTLVALLPFANKAFHIDDTAIIYSAREILISPLSWLSDASINWFGTPQPLRHIIHPPLVPYYTALIIKTIGEGEYGMHLSFLIFPVIAVISLYLLGKRFTDEQAPLIVLLFVFTPAFLTSATNIMEDIPLLALFLASLSCFIYGLDKNDKLFLILAGILMGLTSLIKYTGLILPLLALFYLLLKKRNPSRIFFSIMPFFIIFGLWCLYNLIYFHGLHIWELALLYYHPGLTNFLTTTIGTLIYMGGMTICPLLFLALLQKRKDWFLYFVTVWASLLLFIRLSAGSKYTSSRMAISVFFISLSLLILQKMAGSLKKEKADDYSDNVFLFMWFIMVFCYNIFIQTWFAAPRYVLMLIPPLVLLLMKNGWFSFWIKKKKAFYIFIYAGIILNFILSVLVAYADYIYADSYRDFAKTYAKHVKEDGTKTWFRGHWGFQYYMEREGFTYLGLNDKPQKGDMIILPFICNHELLPESLKKGLEYKGITRYGMAYPFRIVSLDGSINSFYYRIGTIPYGISSEPFETFEAWQVK